MRVKYLPQDNDARIHGGIVRYNGTPYILSLNSQTEFFLSPIYRKVGSEVLLVKSEDPLLDVSSPPLGYVNGKAACLYLMRKPERKYKQTLRTDSVIGFFTDGRIADNSTVHSVMFSKAGESMFLGVYPELKFATSKITNDTGVSSIALSRYVALHRNGDDTYVLIKNEIVGVYDHKETKVTLKKSNYSWIPERYLSQFEWKVE